jgi:hypothetical protein
MAAYYPRRVARFADLQKAYPGFETYDDFEEDRIESVAITKSRGKGAPKKKRTAAGKWEIAERKTKGKRALLTCMQNPRSLARRRGRRCTSRKTLCLAIIPRKAKAGACKNTHRYMDLKTKEEEHWNFRKKEAFMEFHWCSFTYLATETNSPCTKYNFQPPHRRCASCAIQHFVRIARGSSTAAQLRLKSAIVGLGS